MTASLLTITDSARRCSWLPSPSVDRRSAAWSRPAPQHHRRADGRRSGRRRPPRRDSSRHPARRWRGRCRLRRRCSGGRRPSRCRWGYPAGPAKTSVVRSRVSSGYHSMLTSESMPGVVGASASMRSAPASQEATTEVGRPVAARLKATSRAGRQAGMARGDVDPHRRRQRDHRLGKQRRSRGHDIAECRTHVGPRGLVERARSELQADVCQPQDLLGGDRQGRHGQQDHAAKRGQRGRCHQLGNANGEAAAAEAVGLIAAFDGDLVDTVGDRAGRAVCA